MTTKAKLSNSGTSKRRALRSISQAGVIAFTSLWLTVAISSVAHADDPTSELKKVLENARLWIVGIAGVVVAIMLTIAGIRYLMGGGDPGETEKAKTALRAAAIGFSIVVLAPILVSILKGILGVE